MKHELKRHMLLYILWHRKGARQSLWPSPQFSRGAGVVVVQLSRDQEVEFSRGSLSCTKARAKMPPKKREKDLDGQKGSRGDNTDHELFLQAFESKPETFLLVSFYSILSACIRSDKHPRSSPLTIFFAIVFLQRHAPPPMNTVLGYLVRRRDRT